MRVGVIGAGGMGREHITNLAALEGVEVVAAAITSAETGTRVPVIRG